MSRVLIGVLSAVLLLEAASFLGLSVASARRKTAFKAMPGAAILVVITCVTAAALVVTALLT